MTDTRLIPNEAIEGLRVHPAAEAMPAMTANEIAALRESIRRDGQLTPVSLLNGMIVDGRHRAAVVRELGRPLVAVDLDPDDLSENEGAFRYVVSTNAARRSLTDSQRAIIAARMVTTRRGSRITASDMGQPEAARLLGVSVAYLRMASAVLASCSESIIDAVFAGRRPLSAVYREMRAAAGTSRRREPRATLVPSFPAASVPSIPAIQSDDVVTALVQRISDTGIDPAAWVHSLPREVAAAFVTTLEQFARTAYDVLDEEQDIAAADAGQASEEADAHQAVVIERGGRRAGGATVRPARGAALSGEVF